MASRKRSISNGSDVHALHKELDEASCPICMDHPHNAVLLLCSSGCRSYICDTSYRHSNCLDRFRKLRSDNTKSPSPPNSLPTNEHSSTNTSVTNLGSGNIVDLTEAQENNNLDESETRIQHTDRHIHMQEGILDTGNSENNVGSSSITRLRLSCPLCRGTVLDWEVVEEARKYLDMKPRSCSRESCAFSGNYRELRQHARRVHPTARPADIDPSRQRAWRNLQHQREYGDIVSAIRSAMPGAIVLGDYVIENGDRVPGERERGSGEASGPWWTTFFLFQMIGSVEPSSERREGRSRGWTRHRRSASSGRRFLWGENLLGLQDEDDEDEDDDNDDINVNILSDIGEDASPIPRRRRRLTRSRSDEDQS